MAKKTLILQLCPADVLDSRINMIVDKMEKTLTDEENANVSTHHELTFGCTFRDTFKQLYINYQSTNEKLSQCRHEVEMSVDDKKMYIGFKPIMEGLKRVSYEALISKNKGRYNEYLLIDVAGGHHSFVSDLLGEVSPSCTIEVRGNMFHYRDNESSTEEVIYFTSMRKTTIYQTIIAVGEFTKKKG